MSEELEEIFIKDLAQRRKITNPKASELIDRCIKLVSTRLNIDYNIVFNTVHDPLYLTACLKGKCSSLKLEECQKACHCIEFEGKCYPRKFEDAEKMNKDPDAYLIGMSTDTLTALVKLASYLYYNFDGGGITDNTFDALEYTLNKRLKTKGRRYEKIGAPPVDKIRAKLPYPMASLNKAKPGSRLLYDFLATDKIIVWSLKLDGVSGEAIYKNGEIDAVYTRGDGNEGGNITYLKEYIKFPEIPADLKQYANIVVRGELILSKKVWETKFEGSYTNIRSFVSAKVNSGHISQGLGDIEFVAYEIINTGIDSTVPKPSKNFKILESIGFTIPDNGFFVSIPIFDLMNLYKDQRKSAEYPIDGLVLTLDEPRASISTTGVASNPTHSVAFKMRLEEQTRESKILNVEWNISRYGRLVPVASYESVYVDGVRLHRASAFNAAHIRDWSMGAGTKIKIARSGDVIPTIVDVTVDNKIEPIFPSAAIGWHWKNSDIILDDIDGNKTVQIKIMDHFFSTIGVPRLREKTLEKLWEAGYKTIQKVTNAKSSDFVKIKGIGKKSADAFYTNIHTTLRKTRIDRFIPASSTLETGIGRKIIKQLVLAYPNFMDESEEELKKGLTKKKIPGLGVKRVANIAKNIPKFREFLYSLNKEDAKYAIEQDKTRRERMETAGYNEKIKDKTFVLTGFFGKTDYELEDYIYDNLGNFSSVVTSGIEAVISGNLLETSTKMLEAQKLGISVLSIEEAVRKYGIPYSKFEREEGDDIPLEMGGDD